jgi:hypothetical protein
MGVVCGPRKQLKPKVLPKGYHQVNVYRDGKQSTLYVHRLVAQAFIPNPDNLPQVNHKDGDKSHNWVGNLEWSTALGNIQHSINVLGVSPIRNFKLSEDDVQRIIQLRAAGLTCAQIAKQFNNVSFNAVYRTYIGKTWTHITEGQ